MMIRQRIPTVIGSEIDVDIDERYQRRPPPGRAIIAVRTPRPIVVIVNPSTPVIRRPTPRFIADPRPSIRRYPRPMTVTIRGPVAVGIYDRDARSPDPAVIVGVNPATIRVEIFPAPNGIVVIPHVIVILETSGEVAFAIDDPVIPAVF